MTALAELAATVRAEGGQLAAITRDPEPQPTPLSDAARARGNEYALLVEAIREGELLHYATGRVLAPEDPDLALLAGDRLYALGLARLAELGDLDAIAALADVIADSARAYAEDRPRDAAAAWDAGLRRIAG